MRKILLFLALLLFQGSFSYAMIECSELEQNYFSLREEVAQSMKQWRDMPDSDIKKARQGKILASMLARGVKIENDYNDCLASVKQLNALITTYFNLGDDYFFRKKWDKAVEQYKKVIEIDTQSYKAHFNIGVVFLKQGKTSDALVFYQKARKFAKGKSQILESKNALEKLENSIKEKKKNETAKSDDPFSHLQYYLDVLGITVAWKKITAPKEVIVAVIDDGIDINHPDLTDHIWIEPGAHYGSSKIKDFVGDKIADNLPTGKHGTMIAGIIGASTNNKKGIAGIAKNVKIMPLRVFDFKGNAREESIINAMYYAINHRANIINLSLGQTQFNYSTKYDEVIKKAYENGVVVIIAAGNGSVLAQKKAGVNTTVNPISPVCNNSGSQKYSVGVESLSQKGVRSLWSNYGSCVSFAAPGENIFSTSISLFNKESGVDYDTSTGTSFSAPMIAGIIALGYNKYGFVSPDTIYKSLRESLKLNSAGNYQVDAAQYLDILDKKQETIKKEQAAFKKNIFNEQRKTDLIVGSEKMSDSDFLVKFGLLDKAILSPGYSLKEFVNRQDVLAMALKVLNVYLPEDYTCRGIFKDITATKPDSRTCQLVETAIDKGIIIKKRPTFQPEEKITFVEMLEIFLNVGNIQVTKYSGGEFEPMQTNIIGTAFHSGLIGGVSDISPTKLTLRSDLFHIARKIYILKNK